MKILILLFLIGFAAARYVDVLEDEDDFLSELSSFAQEFDEDELKQGLKEKLKGKLDDVVSKMKDGIETGKGITLKMIRDLKDCLIGLKELGVSITDKVKTKIVEILDKAAEKTGEGLVKAGLEKLRDLIKKIGKRETEEGKRTLVQKLHDLLKKLHEKVSDDKMHEMIDERFPKESLMNHVLKKLLEKGRLFLENFLNWIAGKGKGTEKRSLKDLYEKFIDAIKDVKLTLHEKILSFLEFLEETSDAGVAVAKDKIAFIKHIAREFLEHLKEVNKDVADRIVKVLRPYKEDLGKLWEEIKKIADSKQQ